MKMPIPRQKFSGLLRLYRLQPNIRDLFVEGTSDKAVLEHLSKGKAPFGSKVHFVDDIELDVGDCSGPGGAKRRVKHVVSFAADFAGPSINGLVDRNLDDLGSHSIHAPLFVTYYADFEFHLLRPEKIGALASIGIGKEIPESVVDASIFIANCLYAIRLVAIDRGLMDSVIPIDIRCFAAKADVSSFDLMMYLVKLDGYQKTGTSWQLLFEAVSKKLLETSANKSIHVNFHEYEGILQILIRNFVWGGFRAEPDWLGRMVRASVFDSSSDAFTDAIVQRVTS